MKEKSVFFRLIRVPILHGLNQFHISFSYAIAALYSFLLVLSGTP